jgi:hypothetical protein
VLFLSKSNCFAFAKAKEFESGIEREGCHSNIDPGRNLCGPTADGCWGTGMCEFIEYAGRNDDPAIESRQKVDTFNLNQVVQREVSATTIMRV